MHILRVVYNPSLYLAFLRLDWYLIRSTRVRINSFIGNLLRFLRLAERLLETSCYTGTDEEHDQQESDSRCNCNPRNVLLLEQPPAVFVRSGISRAYSISVLLSSFLDLLS